MTATALRAEEQVAAYLVAPLLTEHLDTFASAPDGLKRLRELVLNLAVRGMLVPQDANDEPAEKLLEKVRAEKASRKSRELSPVALTEAPYRLPKGWIWTRLASAGITNPRNDADDDSEASFVPMAMISAKLGTAHSQEARPWRDIKNGFTHFAESDVGIAKITPCFENGKSCVFRGLRNGVGAGTTELHVFRPVGESVIPEYVLIYLKSSDFLRRGEAVMTGTAGQKRLPRSFFEENPFPLPSIAEQSRIVAKVEELMALIDRLEAKVGAGDTARGKLLAALLAALAASPDAAATAEAWAQLAPYFDLLLQTPADVDRLQQTLLALAVKGRLVPQDPDDEPAAELLKRIRAEKDRLIAAGKIKRDKPLLAIGDDEIPHDLPEGWSWVRFSQVIDVETNLVPPADYFDWPQIAPDLIEKGTGKLIGSRTVADAGIKSPNHLFRAGQIIYSKIRPSLSKAVIATFDGLCSADMYPLRVRIDTRYALLYILSQGFLEQVAVAENRVKMPKLNQEALNNFFFPLPPLAEQSRIAAAVASLTVRCDRLRERLAARRELSAKLAAALTESALA